MIVTKKLLIIDDSLPFLRDLQLLLSKDYRVTIANSGKTGLELIRKDDYTAILLDLFMPDVSGMEILQELQKDSDFHTPIIVVSDHSDTTHVVEAMRLGASDFLPKDFSIGELGSKISIALERNDYKSKLHYINSEIQSTSGAMIFWSEKMNKVSELLTRYAQHACDVLIRGETGAGKDIAAFELYRRSKTLNRIFLTVPVSGINESLAESELFGYEKGAFTGADRPHKGKLAFANHGTLYIPEISSVSEAVQIKLLQFMQYKTISRLGENLAQDTQLQVRLLFATNEDLEQKVREGKMRSDFFYRIDTLSVTIPPLRDRPDDIPLLANHFCKSLALKHLNREVSISQEVLERFQQMLWHGNVRELQSAVLKCIFMLDDHENEVRLKHIQAGSSPLVSENLPITDYETAKTAFKKEYFNKLLTSANGNITAAAQKAGLSRAGLLKAIKELDIR